MSARGRVDAVATHILARIVHVDVIVEPRR